MVLDREQFDGAELPPPPPIVPKSTPPRLPMARTGLGTNGQKIQLLTNHFQVTMPSSNAHFYQYSVKIAYEDETEIELRGIGTLGRKVLDKLHEVYNNSDSDSLGGTQFAYDGEKTLFTLGNIPFHQHVFSVVLEEQRSSRLGRRGGSPEENQDLDGERKRLRRPQGSKTYKVELEYVTKIPLQAIANTLRGQDCEDFQEAIRVLNTILKQHAAKKGCLLVRQSFFHNQPRNFCDIGGGVSGCRGFHSSFRATQGGLSLNIDVSTTMIVKPGPVLEFLMANQNVTNPDQLDWAKAKRTLKFLRIVVRPSNMEFKITGLSDKIFFFG